jgi:hypothetical protein
MNNKKFNNCFTEINDNNAIFMDRRTKLNGNFHINDYIYFTNDNGSHIILKINDKNYAVNAKLLFSLNGIDFCIKDKINKLEKDINLNKIKCKNNNIKINIIKKKFNKSNKKINNPNILLANNILELMKIINIIIKILIYKIKILTKIIIYFINLFLKK